MKFSLFLKNIDRLQSAKLGGLDSLFKMVPAERVNFNLEEIAARKPKKAAVLVLFYPDKNDETYFILTERAQYKGVHSAQISFPGGKKDKDDIDLKMTALREANEEIGIENITILRELTTTYIPPSNFYVTPFLAYAHSIQKLTPNREVNSIIKVKLADLLNDNNLSKKNLTTSYMKNVDVPCFKLNNHIVWGATAMMLSEIKDLIKSL